MLKNKSITVIVAILLISLGLFIELIINPLLHYHIQQPPFLWSNIFFNPFLLYPGGLTDYLSLFLSQFFFFKWAGTLIILLIGVSISLLIRGIAKNKSITLDLILFSLPIILLTTLFFNYKFPLTAPLKILIALIAVYGVNKISNRTIRFIVGSATCLLLYYVSGGIALFAFAINYIIAILIKEKSTKTIIESVTIVLLSLAIPYITFKFIFLITLNNAYFKYYLDTPLFLTYKAQIIDYMFVAVIPLILLSSLLNIKWLKQIQVFNEPTFKVKGLIQVAVVILLSYLLLNTYYNKKEKQLVQLDYDAYTENWTKIVKDVKFDGNFDILEIFQLNRAQAHLGTLTNDLFRYPQLLGSESLFPETFTTGQITIPASDLYFDLGYIGNSQRWIYEAQTLTPYSPRVLKRLILNHLIYRNYTAADKYLKVLNQNFLYKDWVNKYSKYITDTTLVDNDNLLAEKRRYMPNDSIISDMPNDKMKTLLNQCNTNKMAYDYLQSYYLLNHMLGDFASRLNTLKEVGYSNLPNSFEQALLLYNLKTEKKTELPEGISINKNNAELFNNFNKIFYQYKGNREAAQRELYQSFGQTLWYYILYDSPKVTNAKIESRAVEY